MKYLIFLIAIASALPLWAASNAERINQCLEENLSTDQKLELSVDMMEWKFEFSDYVIRNAGKCFENITGIPATFESGKGLIFSPENQTLADDKIAKDRQKALEIKEERESKNALINSLVTTQRCRIQKAKSIDRYLDLLGEVVSDKNKTLIENETEKACIELHKNNKSEAILNEICREVFKSKMHPDLNLSVEGDLYAKLKSEFFENALALALIRKTLSALDPKFAPQEQSWERPDLLNDAMRICD